jgi:hypothetical protein
MPPSTLARNESDAHSPRHRLASSSLNRPAIRYVSRQEAQDAR